jgi:hypothetical protein
MIFFEEAGLNPHELVKVKEVVARFFFEHCSEKCRFFK